MSSQRWLNASPGRSPSCSDSLRARLHMTSRATSRHAARRPSPIARVEAAPRGRIAAAVCEFCARYVGLLDGHRDALAAFRIETLSAREREVFMLLGLGLSNADLVE